MNENKSFFERRNIVVDPSKKVISGEDIIFKDFKLEGTAE
jgi:hypothetical protein